MFILIISDPSICRFVIHASVEHVMFSSNNIVHLMELTEVLFVVLKQAIKRHTHVEVFVENY